MSPPFSLMAKKFDMMLLVIKYTVGRSFMIIKISKGITIALFGQKLLHFWRMGGFLPIGAFVMGRVCACSLRNRLVYDYMHYLSLVRPWITPY